MKLKITALALVFSGILSMKAQQSEITANNKDSRFLITADFNYSYRIGEISDNIQGPQRDYMKKLKSGISYDVSAYYLFKHIGVGLKYNTHRSKGEINNASITAPNGETGFGTLSDDITISFYGAGVIYEIGKSYSRHKGYIESGLGYIQYKNDAYALGSYEFKGGTLGAYAGISYQYEAFDNFSIGPKLNLMTGVLTEYKLTYPDGDTRRVDLDDEGESLTSINIGLIVSYRF